MLPESIILLAAVCMHLNETEEQMLKGKFGKAPESAMTILNEYRKER
jgi:predicted aconitase